MASLLPLLHDLLPMIIPSEVRVARSNELVSVEERAERPPWHRQTPTGKEVSGNPSRRAADVGAEDAKSSSGSDWGGHEPIQLFDHEEHRMAAALVNAEQRGMTVQSDSARTAPVPLPSADPKVFRKDVMVGVTDKMCVSVVTVKPRSATAIHHYGEQDTIIYATSGPGVLLISPPVNAVKALRADIKGEQPTPEEEQPRRLELDTGDFAFIPAWTEHQVLNERNDGDVSWVVVRSGSEPVQVDLDGWGGERIEE